MVAANTNAGQILLPSKNVRRSLTPHLDLVCLDLERRSSVSYAEGRAAINADFHTNKQDLGEATAKRTRKKYRQALVEALDGKVVKKQHKNDATRTIYVVQFPDGSEANL